MFCFLRVLALRLYVYWLWFGSSAKRRGRNRIAHICAVWRKKFAAQKWLSAICALMLISASACVANSADSFCLIAEPIFVDPQKDTPETLRQIDRHNAIGEKICSW